MRLRGQPLSMRDSQDIWEHAQNAFLIHGQIEFDRVDKGVVVFIGFLLRKPHRIAWHASPHWMEKCEGQDTDMLPCGQLVTP